MLIPGLVSVTFRPLSPTEIIRLVADAGLRSIEWGGDVHVPPTEEENASAVARATCAAGLSVASYGSYFKGGYTEQASFAAALNTARILGAPNIRVWAGGKGSEVEENRAAVAESLRQCAAMAAQAGITLSLELHQNTLTDTPDSALRLIDEVGHENLHLYWQPNQFRDTAYNVNCLRTLLPHITNVHVFSWVERNRFPLADGEHAWRQYIELLGGSGRDHGMLMEFVCDSSPEQFMRDAATLRTWLD